MSGITMSTAVEMFTNHGDLQIAIGQKDCESKFSIGISRGPGHNFKLMLTTEPFAQTQGEAIQVIKDTLWMVHEVVTRELENKESIFFRHLNPDGQKIDELNVLNPGIISRILDELRQHQVARTWEILAPGIEQKY